MFTSDFIPSSDIPEDKIVESEEEASRVEDERLENLVDMVMSGDTEARADVLAMLRKTSYFIHRAVLSFRLNGERKIDGVSWDAFWDVAEDVCNIKKPENKYDTDDLPF